jgi:hypothetical protein
VKRCLARFAGLAPRETTYNLSFADTKLNAEQIRLKLTLRSFVPAKNAGPQDDKLSKWKLGAKARFAQNENKIKIP